MQNEITQHAPLNLVAGIIKPLMIFYTYALYTIYFPTPSKHEALTPL